MDDSVIIRWVICCSEIVRKTLELEDWNEILAESSTKHQGSQLFHERLSSDVNRLIKSTTVSPFMQNHVT